MESLYTSRSQEQSPEGEQQILLNYADGCVTSNALTKPFPFTKRLDGYLPKTIFELCKRAKISVPLS